MSKLILVRHGESEWNAKGLWTGLTDISLNKKGEEEAKNAALKLKGIKIDILYTSVLKRTKQTGDIIKKELGLENIQEYQNVALNERDYGIFTGQNKWQIKKQVGEEEFLKIRRSWDYPIQKGESLKDVYKRVVPYYQNEILPKLKMGLNMIICAHGNSLRALIKYLENIKDEKISDLELKTGEVYVYSINEDGKIIAKNII